MKKTMLASLIGAGALLASAVGVAGTITVGPVSIGPAQTDWTTTAGLGAPGSQVLGGGAAQVSQFNAALGTLTAVSVTVNGSFSGTQTITNTGQSAIFIQNASTGATWFFDILDNTGGVGDATASAGPAGVHTNEFLAAGDTITEAVSAAAAPTVLDGLSFGTLADFTGNGTWAFGCAALSTVTFTGGATGNTAFTGNADCDVSVEYTFAAPAPIPGSLLLMAAGLLGFGASRRK